MKITTESVHRCLTYVAAVTNQGYRLSVDEFNAYLEAVRSASIPVGLIGLVSSLTLQPGPREPSEMQTVGWLSEDQEGYVVLTGLGRAVLTALDQGEMESDVPLDVVLDASDPIAYAQVINRIAQHDNPLLVDAYFKLDHLLHIVHQTKTSRLLIGPKADVPGLATALSSLPPDRKLEIRVSEAIHDRYVIPMSGPIDMLGTSLSGVGKKPSAIIRVNPPGADAIRQAHEELWTRAKPLSPSTAMPP